MLRTFPLLLPFLFINLILVGQQAPAGDTLKTNPHFLAGHWRQGFLNRTGMIENYNGKETWFSLDDNGSYEFEACNHDDSCARIKGKWHFNEKTNRLTLDSGLFNNTKSDYQISMLDTTTFSMQEINLADGFYVGREMAYHKLKKKVKKTLTKANPPIPDINYTQNNDPKLLIGYWRPCLVDKIDQSDVSTSFDYYLVFTEDFNFYYEEINFGCGTHIVWKWEYDQESDVLSLFSQIEVYMHKIVRLDATSLIIDFYDRRTGETSRRCYRKCKF